jgi:hypothetical protein
MFAQVDIPERFSKTVRQMRLHGLRWFIRLLQGGLIHGLIAHRFRRIQFRRTRVAKRNCRDWRQKVPKTESVQGFIRF